MFGKLVDIVDKKSPVAWDHLDADPDLKEHMVGILFSRSKLTYLQKQVNGLEILCSLTIIVLEFLCFYVSFLWK